MAFTRGFMTQQLPEGYLTAKQLAQCLKISKGTLENLCRRGLPRIKIGKARRFLLSEVQVWLRQLEAEALEQKRLDDELNEEFEDTEHVA